MFQALSDFLINLESESAEIHQRCGNQQAGQFLQPSTKGHLIVYRDLQAGGIHTVPLTEDINRAQFCPLQCLCIPHPRKHVTIKLERGLSIWGRQSCVGSNFGDQSNLRVISPTSEGCECRLHTHTRMVLFNCLPRMGWFSTGSVCGCQQLL